MSLYIRLMLIIVSLVTFIYIVRKIKKSQMEPVDATYWIVFLAILLFLSIFPNFASEISKMIGVESPVNLVFLSIIFVILIYEFRISVKITKLEERQKELIEELAVRDRINKEVQD